MPGTPKTRKQHKETMKPQDSVRLATAIGPAAMISPPLAILAALVGVGVLWLLSEDNPKDKPQEKALVETPVNPESILDEDAPPVSRPALKSQVRKVMREDLAEALDYGARVVTRREAVEALEALGFGKTAAYKALAEDGKFSSLLTFLPDGHIEWNG